MSKDKLLLRVTDLVYEDGDDGPIVKIAGRGENGKRHTRRITGTYPVFWVPEEESVYGHESLLDVEEGYESYDNISLKKLTMELPEDVGEYREEFELAYESDVPYVRRVSVDYGLAGYIRVPEYGNRHDIDAIETDIDEADVKSITPRVMMADIETMPPEDGDFEEYVENTPEPIIMITTYDTYSEEYKAIAIDDDDKIDPKWTREYLEDHWEGHDDYEKYTDCDIKLVRCEDERELLEAFIAEITSKRPDLISGWNWTDFDWQYINNRMDQFDNVREHKMADLGYFGGYKKRRLCDGLPAFDMMRAFCGKMSYSDWRSEALDYVAQEELDVGKVEDINIREEFDDNRSRLLAYNIIDVQLTVGLDDKNDIHEFFYMLSDLCGIQIYDTMSEMRLVEGFILSRRSEDEILPFNEDKDLTEISGGLVLSPSDGLREWVAVLDLKSLYPSSIISLNVSREMRDDENGDVTIPDMPLNEEKVPGDSITEKDISWDVEDGAKKFKLTTEGIMPKYVKKLFKTRRKFKNIRNDYDQDEEEELWEVWDNKQRGIKVVMNSFFGVSDNPHFRLADEGMGDAITGPSRYVTWRGVQIAEEMGYDVAYGDTDSIMIELADPDEDVSVDEVISRGYELEERINDEMDQVADDFGIPDNHPFLDISNLPHDLPDDSNHAWAFEFEKLFRRFIQTGSKKRYAGLAVWKEGQKLKEPKESITGYEAVRSDAPEVTSKVQKKFISRILHGQDFDEVSEYIQRIAKEIENGEKSFQEIGIPSVLNKPPEEYPNRPIKRATLHANQHLDQNWREGDEPWLIHVKDTPSMTPNISHLAVSWTTEELPEGYTPNYKKHVRKHIKQPLDPFTNEMGWDFNELKQGVKSKDALGSLGLDDDGGESKNPFGDENQRETPENPFADAGSTASQSNSDADRGDESDASQESDSDDSEASEGGSSRSALSW